MIINSLERLGAALLFGFAMLIVYGFLSMAWATTAAEELAQAQGEAEETDDHPATPVMFPVFYQLVEGYNGTAMPAAHGHGPVSFASKKECLRAIELRSNQNNYYCLKYESAKTIDYVFPGDGL